MPRAVHIVINQSGVRELLRSDAIAADLKARADRIASAAGDGMVVETGLTEARARAVVITSTIEAIIEEAHHRALTRAIDAGRG